MDSIIIVSDMVTEDGMRQLHVMSNTPIHMRLPDNAEARQTQEAGAYHLRSEWPFCGMLDICPREWPKPRRLYVQRLLGGQRVSDAVRVAAEAFERATGFAPKYAFVREFPQAAEWGQDVYGCIFLAAEWIPRNCVAVGGRR